MGRLENPVAGDGPAVEFARRLRRLRDEAGLTYRQIAQRAHYSPATLSMAANGRNLPNWPVVEAFVTACGEDPDPWRAVWAQAQDERLPPKKAEDVNDRGRGLERAALQFRILGPVGVSRGSVDLEIGGIKSRILLAMLLLNANHRVSANRLVEAVVDDYDYAADKGLAVLQVRISRLRRVLREGSKTDGQVSLVSMAGGYRLVVDEDKLDYTRFKRQLHSAREASRLGAPGQAAQLYQQALEEWSGEPLANMPGAVFGGERAALIETLRGTKTERLGIELGLGQYHDVAVECRRLLAEHPLDQQVAALLMQALHLMGRPAEALDVYRDLRRRLRDELGIDPSKRIRSLHVAVLRNDLSVSWAGS